MDRVIKQTYPDGQLVKYTYNNQGLLDSIPGVIKNLDYNASGHVTIKEYANNKRTDYSYNSANQKLKSIVAQGIQNLDYSYDKVGNIQAIKDTVGGKTEKFVYDDLDRLIAANDGSYTDKYKYNAIGNLLSVNHNGIASNYAYSTKSRPHAVVKIDVPSPRLASFVVHYGDKFTLNKTVPLNAVIVDSANEYLASEREDFSGASWKPYTTTPLFTLSSGYGRKTVYFKVRKNGKESSLKFDSIIYASDKNSDNIPDHFETDTDEDGIPDAWEKRYGLNLNNASDGSGDLDGDGVSNSDEFLHRTNPTNADSDGDGWNDQKEAQTGTQPNKPDTDNDGLLDSKDPDSRNPNFPSVSEHLSLRQGHFDSGGGTPRKGATYAMAADSFGYSFRGQFRVSPFQVFPTEQNLGAVLIGKLSSLYSSVIRNTSNSSQTIVSMSLTGADSKHFLINNNQCDGVTLPSGGRCTIDIAFKPGNIGAKEASIQVTANEVPPLTIGILKGVGIYKDSDGDGIPDSYEIGQGIDRFDPFDGKKDADGDGYSNLKEYLSGSNPNNPNLTPATLKLIVDAENISVAEGATVTFKIKLSETIASPVTVNVKWFSGDKDIVVASGATLNFNSANWNIFKTVTVAAATDQDTIESNAVIRLTAANLSPVDIAVTERESGSKLYSVRGMFNSGGNYRMSETYRLKDEIGSTFFNGFLSVSTTSVMQKAALLTESSNAQSVKVASSSSIAIEKALMFTQYEQVQDAKNSENQGSALNAVDKEFFIPGYLNTLTKVRHIWERVRLPKRFNEPVVILGPPTRHDLESGLARLRNISNNGFDISFQEWMYLDGIHSPEVIPFIFLEQGRYVLPDGGIWEVGTFDIKAPELWHHQRFNNPFTKAPYLFLTIQTDNGSNPVSARVRSLSRNGFEAGLFGEEVLGDEHGSEKVGYIAVVSPSKSGIVSIGGSKQSYLLKKITVNKTWIPIMDNFLMFEEVQSADEALNNFYETVAVLGLGKQLFAQVISTKDSDAISLRLRTPENTDDSNTK